jgi:hypothetical protein
MVPAAQQARIVSDLPSLKYFVTAQPASRLPASLLGLEVAPLAQPDLKLLASLRANPIFTRGTPTTTESGSLTL